ncbi:hypothetical protein D3C78_1394280 [compost metagenome]
MRDGRLTGQISRLRIAEINVPHAWREGLREGLVRDRDDKPGARLRLWLSVGQRLEPWIDSVPEIQPGDGQGKPASADSLASSTRP